MAEVQRNTQSGETAARFIEFVMMQAQNASLFLGLIPNPGTGKPEVNLELARLFIDQLAMIQEKTRGNLTNEEGGVLRNALTQLQMAFVEVSQGNGPAEHSQAHGEDQDAPADLAASPEPAAAKASEPAPAPAAAADVAADDSRESKKRFSKSYGG